MYITYADYLSHGGEFNNIGSASFARLEEAAATVADKYTQGRLKSAEMTDRLAYMMVELIDKVNSYGSAADTANVASVSNDGYSVTYVDAATVSAQQSAECRDIVMRYASEYCYRGVDA